MSLIILTEKTDPLSGRIAVRVSFTFIFRMERFGTRECQILPGLISDHSCGCSVLHGNEQLFAAKYLTYLPTNEQLRAEIEAQKEVFRLQQGQDG